MSRVPLRQQRSSVTRSRSGRTSIQGFLRKAQLCILIAGILPLRGPNLPARVNILGRISKVVPFAGVTVGYFSRNRTYRQAETFISDRKQYYDGLRETARGQLVDRHVTSLRGSQVAAYIKLVALIEQQRTAELNVAEARKKAAREQFHARIEESAQYAIMGSRLAQDLIGAMKTGVGSAQQLLERAVNAVVPGGAGALRDLARARQFAQQLSLVGGAVGGETGYKLRQLGDRIAKTIDQSGGEIRPAIEQMRGDLRQLNQGLDALGKVGRAPSAGEVITRVSARVLPGGKAPDSPAIDAALELLSKLEMGNASLKQAGRAARMQGLVARCAALGKAYKDQLQALREAADAGEISPSLLAKCLALQRGQLQQIGRQMIPKPEPDPPAPSKPAALPRVTAEGQFTETVTGSGNDSVAMGTTFQLTADLAAGTISGTLKGSRTTHNNPIQCIEQTNPSLVYDSGTVDYTDSYTASFSGSLEPKSGAFTISIAPKGNTTDRKTKPFTVERCLHYNAAPAPGSNPFTGVGTISGFVRADGSIEFTTRWLAGAVTTSGTWSGTGAVILP